MELPHPLFFPDGSAGVPPHGGPRRRVRRRAEQDGRVADFTGLVLGCIEMKFCKKICV